MQILNNLGVLVLKKNFLLILTFSLIVSGIFLTFQESYIKKTVNFFIENDFELNSVMRSAVIQKSEPLDLSKIIPALPDSKKASFVLRASSLNSLENGAVVDKWIDESSNKIELNSNSSSLKLKKNAINKLSSVVFSGDSFFENPNVLGEKIISNNATTVVAVVKPLPTSIEFSEFYSWGDCQESRFLVHILGENQSNLQFQFGDPKQHTNSTLVESLSGHYHLMVFHKDSAKSLIEINGVRIGQRNQSNGVGYLDVAKSASMKIGTSDCKHIFKGEIAEILIYKNLTSAERYGMTKYLMNKYDLVPNYE
jgi:hypothetical protein